MCSQQYNLIYFYLVSYCQPNKAGLSCSLKRWLQFQIASYHMKILIQKVYRVLVKKHETYIDWLNATRRISSYIKIHLH